MIRLDDVWKSYAGVPALRGVSLSVADGDALLLTGPSGAGKSTLLKLIFAAEKASTAATCSSTATASASHAHVAGIPYVRRNIGVVFQDFKLLGGRSALENVAVSLEILGLPRATVRLRAQVALDAVGLGQKAAVHADRLSGGEQQRVAVARAIVGEPAILLCDEPTGNLDPERARDLLFLLDEIHRRGTTLVIATHDPQVIDFSVAASWRRARLAGGELIDAELPVARPMRLDEETAGFSSREDKDATNVALRLWRST